MYMQLHACKLKLCSSLIGAIVEVFVNGKNVLQGFFFQDKQMKQVFSAYPELLCIDATYKLLELRFPLYVMWWKMVMVQVK